MRLATQNFIPLGEIVLMEELRRVYALGLSLLRWNMFLATWRRKILCDLHFTSEFVIEEGQERSSHRKQELIQRP